MDWSPGLLKMGHMDKSPGLLKVGHIDKNQARYEQGKMQSVQGTRIRIQDR